MSTAFALPADFEIQDDLDVTNPGEVDDYADGGQNAAPLPAANYQFRIKKGGLKTKKDGTLVLRLEQVEITGVPEFEGRVVYLFQEFNVKPFTRKDPQGNERVVNNLADIVRSHDVGLSFSNVREGLDNFLSVIEQGGSFAGRFDWVAEDYKYRIAALEELDAEKETLPLDVYKQRKNAIYRAAKLQGQKKFVNPKTGAPITVWVNPASGHEVEVRAQIMGFIPSTKHEETKFGPRG
jgi:hypothetical protein